MTATQELIQFITVFLNRDLTPDNVRKIQFHLTQEVLSYQSKIISDFCAKNNICPDCYEQYKGKHECQR